MVTTNRPPPSTGGSKFKSQRDKGNVNPNPGNVTQGGSNISAQDRQTQIDNNPQLAQQIAEQRGLQITQV